MSYIKLNNQEFEILRDLRTIYPEVYNFLIENHINIILKLYQKQYKYYWFLDEDDIIQEGCIAMIEAIDRYNPEKLNNGSYRSYLTQCIKTYLKTYKDVQYILWNNGGVKMPRNLAQQTANFKLWCINKGNRPIEILCKEFCEEVGIAYRTLYQALQMSYSSYSSVDKSMEDNSVFNKLIHTDEYIYLERDYSVLYKALDRIRQKRGKEVVICRVIKEMTLKETGELLGVGGERVRQIQKRALSEMHDFLVNRMELI